MRALLVLLAALAASPAAAQLRPFSCVGVEQLEEEAVVITFVRDSDRVGNAALELLAPFVAAARAEPQRNICVLGFAGPDEGGAETQSRLAARRARVVALELAKLGIERDRVRAEARTRGFSAGRGPGGVERRYAVRLVLLPAERDPS
ncbi:MAG: hypothetical protein MUC64_01475 [Rubritepida sp.]|jgi:outer membrane protein OmpA-like peptidoglycan-associated protein|nr:hypothetical protein [Rubritepida sp.]